MPIPKVNSARNFLSLNGTFIPLQSLEGGVISAEVIENDLIPNEPAVKHLGSINYGDYIFETGIFQEITELINKSLTSGYLRIGGSFITTDFNLKAEYEDVFLDAVLTETIIPRCDAASREAAFLGLRLKPTSIKNTPGDGKIIDPKNKSKPKPMMQSNFRFELGKLPCARINSIESFTIKSGLSNKTLVNRRQINAVNSIDIPNLFLTTSAADLKPWMEWHKQFLIDGKNSQSDELTGRLVFLSPNLKDELLAISLQGVGIFSLERIMENGQKISRFKVGLYCERMELK